MIRSAVFFAEIRISMKKQGIKNDRKSSWKPPEGYRNPDRMDNQKCTGVLHSISDMLKMDIAIHMAKRVQRLLFNSDKNCGEKFFLSILTFMLSFSAVLWKHAHNHKRFMCTWTTIKTNGVCVSFFPVHRCKYKSREYGWQSVQIFKA